MTAPVRLLTTADATQAWELGALTFGSPAEVPPGFDPGQAGLSHWGAFEGDRLVAGVVDRHQGHFFGGRSVPAAGLASVAVAPDRRGSGLGRQLLTHTLEQARDRGAAVSTLFPSTATPYRKLGWERAGVVRRYAVPTASLGDVRGTLAIRPAAPNDDLVALHGDVVRTGTGTTDRASAAYAAERPRTYDGTTAAHDADGLQGFATWDRGRGPSDTGVLTVHDLVFRTPEAGRSLLGHLATWASVTPIVHIRLADHDPAWLQSAFVGATVQRENPWMLRLVDASAAVAARGWPPLDGAVDLFLDDEVCPWNAGAWRLVLAGGSASLEPGGSGTTRMTARGAAAWFAGTSPAVLRRAGLVEGGADDAFLTAATAGPPASLVDYF